MESKINRLLQDWPPHVVGTQRWLTSKGVDYRLADKYVRSGWLKRFGHGAYIRAGSSVDWPGAVHALQTQLGLDIHPGAITAFEQSPFWCEVLGADFVDYLCRIKRAEWARYLAAVSEWEQREYFTTF